MGPFFQLPSNEETSELKTADAAVFALKGRRQEQINYRFDTH